MQDTAAKGKRMQGRMRHDTRTRRADIPPVWYRTKINQKLNTTTTTTTP